MKPSPSSAAASLKHAGTGRGRRLLPILLLSLFLVVLLCAALLDFRRHRLVAGNVNNISAFQSTTTTTTASLLRILVGVVTMADRYEIRHLHRLVHSLQLPIPDAQIDVKFVFCRLTRDEQRALVSLEILRHDDILILDCPKENMNSGKTYRFFKAVAEMYNSSAAYDYVMKTDDDTYLRFPALVSSLRPLPREDLYYGNLHLPASAAKDREGIFMCGMGYVLSWDLVQWVAASEIARNNSIGLEDKMVAKWLREGNKGRNVHDTRPSDAQVAEWRSGGDRVFDAGKAVQYDLPEPPMRFVPNTISVHRLKDNVKWAQALRFFNATAGIKESIFYNVSKIHI